MSSKIINKGPNRKNTALEQDVTHPNPEKRYATPDQAHLTLPRLRFCTDPLLGV